VQREILPHRRRNCNRRRRGWRRLGRLGSRSLQRRRGAGLRAVEGLAQNRKRCSARAGARRDSGRQLSLPKTRLAAHWRSERYSISVAPRIQPRAAGVLPLETGLRIANERKARCVLTRALGSLCRSGPSATRSQLPTSAWRVVGRINSGSRQVRRRVGTRDAARASPQPLQNTRFQLARTARRSDG
jgi:hypothetical protein